MSTYSMTPGEIKAWDAIMSERARQIAKFGDQSDKSPVEWISVLTEEVGETAKEANDLHFASGYDPERRAKFERMRTELIQSAAVCLAWAGLLFTARCSCGAETLEGHRTSGHDFVQRFKPLGWDVSRPVVRGETFEAL